MYICTNYLNSFSVNAGVGAGAGSGAGARAGPEFRPGKLGVVEPGTLRASLPCAAGSLPYAVVPLGVESLSDSLGIAQPRKKFF